MISRANLKLFRHLTQLQIRFCDLDRLDHVNNAVYLQYMETARVDYFNTLLGVRHDWKKQGLVVVRNEISYYDSIHLNDRIACLTRCSKIGNKSITLENVIIRIKGKQKQLIAEGKGVLVCMNYRKMTSIKVPENWKRKILAFEKIPPENS